MNNLQKKGKMIMLNVSVIGIGNAGNQVAALAKENGFEAVALNSSESDLATVEDKVGTIVIGDKRGAGKDRKIAKGYIAKAAKQIIETETVKDLVENKDICVIVSSTGGGTGSGMSPILQNILSQYFPNTHFIIAGILPTIGESLATQHNTFAYLEDMLKSEPTYLLYDNSKVEAATPVEMLGKVNAQIIADLKVMRGDFQKATPYNSIDEQDAMKMYRTPGRLVITETEVDGEGQVEPSLVKATQNSPHAELDLDNVIQRRGLILNLTESVYESINFDLPLLTEEFGEPIEGFDHSYMNPKESDTNYAVMIMAGLSFPNDRTEKIKERITTAEKAIERAEKPSALDLDTSSIESMRGKQEKEKVTMDLDDILDLY